MFKAFVLLIFNSSNLQRSKGSKDLEIGHLLTVISHVILVLTGAHHHGPGTFTRLFQDLCLPRCRLCRWASPLTFKAAAVSSSLYLASFLWHFILSCRTKNFDLSFMLFLVSYCFYWSLIYISCVKLTSLFTRVYNLQASQFTSGYFIV